MQQILVITYPSALEFWLDGTNIDTEKYEVSSRNLDSLPTQFITPNLKQSAEELILDLGLSKPISFMTPYGYNRNSHEWFKNYVRPKYLPKDSFIPFDTSLYPNLDKAKVLIASPEYCFLCAARYCSLAQLVEMGNNLCAIYVRDDESSFGQRRRKAVTNKKELMKYLSEAQSFRYSQKACTAAKFVAENSYSPMESKLAVMAGLPKHYGGYGTKEYVLNYDVFHNEMASAFLKSEKSNCDIVWTKQKIILEYDSDIAHGNAEQYAYDKKKYRALQMSGYKVFPVVRQDILTLDYLDELFFSIRKELGMKREKTQFDKYLQKRQEVFKELFKTR